MKNMGFSFSGYKSFYNESVIDDIKNLNIIIGRNNSGKSSCLDIVEKLIDFSKIDDKSDIFLFYTLSEDTIIDANDYYNKSMHSSDKKYSDLLNYLNTHKGEKIKIKVNKYEWITIEQEVDYQYSYTFDRKYPNCLTNFLEEYVLANMPFSIIRIDAERNILPEIINSEKSVIDNNGNGTTNVFANIINKTDYDESIVEVDVLKALNEIIYPDGKFDRISVQYKIIQNEYVWEIYLFEGTKRYPLSSMGSGLKTILLVLINLLSTTSKYRDLYLFEELENNLHPALQRRLFEYIYNYAIEYDATIFLTTHSHIPINMYYGRDNVQIYHVNKDTNGSTITKVDNNSSQYNVLDDLNIKASDILQSNGVIWVEGPSDRVYIKKWLEIYNYKYVEGVHYQFLYYGGRLLSHYSADDSKEENFINILKTNRNSAIVIDSDIREVNAEINNTKKRIRDEFDKIGSFCWITKGKEIENYLSKDAINHYLKTNIEKQCGIYELFPEYIGNYYKNFSSKKVSFSHEICKYITKENSDILDLKDQIKSLAEQIENWNK